MTKYEPSRADPHCSYTYAFSLHDTGVLMLFRLCAQDSCRVMGFLFGLLLLTLGIPMNVQRYWHGL